MRATIMLSASLTLALLACTSEESPTQPDADGNLVPAAPESSPTLATAVAAGPLSFRQISTGSIHACGVTTDDRAYCWGQTLSPAAVATNLRFREVRVGLRYSCGLTTDSRIYCWGTNLRGQLGDGTSSQFSFEPVQLAGGRRYRLLRAGLEHGCAITLAGVTFCWGSNDYGQLGDGTTTDRRAPRKVAGGLTFLRVSTGNFHTCGVTSAKKAYCWGQNSSGQIGDGTGNARHKPVAVAGGLTFSGVGPGGSHTCGVTTGKIAYCWGYNWFGQVGDGTNATDPPFVIMRLTPVPVAGGLRFDAVLAAAGMYTCGVTTGNRGYCWGSNTNGYLGDGTTANRSTPTPVAPPM